MEFLYEYGLFFAKTVTFLIAFALFLGILSSIKSRGKNKKDGDIAIENVNERYEDMEEDFAAAILSKDELKKRRKAQKKAAKKKADPEQKSRLFVLFFNGDIRASDVELLREEITAVLTTATTDDEILLLLESSGGLVHSYGLAASQLRRIRDRNIPLTVAVDKVAASGGYMMACVANKVIAAPFAVIGSIGVIAQLPNFNRLLEKHDVDYEQYTAGEYKRTVTLFGKNTDKAREKFQQELNETHLLFKDFIRENRPSVAIDEVATGEHWYGQQALSRQLVDVLQTSDDYLLARSKEADIYEVTYAVKESLSDKVSKVVTTQLEQLSLLLLRKWY